MARRTTRRTRGGTRDQEAALVRRALEASARAYAPYSGYHVGAALLAADGQVFTGCNVENASYPLCICAERVALGTAVAAGQSAFKVMAVATGSSPPATPCGACRQVMHELGPGLKVLLCNHAGELRRTTVRALLPAAFSGGQLTRRPPAVRRRRSAS
ncbi:MAG: cytidine deaminase [Deltaproteobacteria bacterium]|nr:cytidine deaminase [Deltaproteobacteria bacterium]